MWWHRQQHGCLQNENFADKLSPGTQSRCIEGVSEVAVTGLPDPRWIESVTAVVVAKAGHVLTQAGILAACSGRLVHFKIPKRVILVEALPKNPSGKLLKRELRLQFAAQEYP